MGDIFDEFLDESDVPDRTLAIVESGQPEPIRDLIDRSFGKLDVEIERKGIKSPENADDAVVLFEDGDVVATSSMETLRNAVLLVNADLYTTGLSGINKYEAPSILTELDDAVYTLRGFPESAKEKLLLIVMSRHIERRALETDAGRLDVAFQKLSRMNDEYGTKRIYERLGRTDVDVHAYGVPDTDPTRRGDTITVHAGDSEPYRRSWFVVFVPPDGIEPAALVAVETEEGRNTWLARWTYDRQLVESIQRHIIEHF